MTSAGAAHFGSNASAVLLRLLADGDVLLMCHCICYVTSHAPPCCHDVQVRPRLGSNASAVLSGLLADGDVLLMHLRIASPH